MSPGNHETSYGHIYITLRPRREHKLPNVLSKEEVKAVLEALSNPKHKAMLSLIYACGLQRSELLNLKPQDVDSKRGLLFIRQGKGRKDRVPPLPERIVEMLRDYYMGYRLKVKRNATLRWLRPAMQPICWRKAPISGISRSCWGTKAARPPGSTPM